MWERLSQRALDNALLFARSLHKQSNIHLSLRIRRMIQIGSLYRKIYSPNDFRAMLRHAVYSFESQFPVFSRVQSRFQSCFARRHSLLLSLASIGLFSWEDNRITDQEITELIDEFMAFEKYQEEEREAKHSQDSNSSSYMIVNCAQADDDEADSWEMIINRPNFHVWRKSVRNSSLFEYKGMWQ